MKKKLISLFLVTMLVLTACGSESITDILSDSIKQEADPVENEPESEERSDGSWAIYWYLCGSDLESEYGFATDDINEMMNVKLPDNVKVVIQTGGASEWQNELISNKKIGRYEYSGEELTQIDELKQANMGEAQTLTDFLSFCNENYPADHKMVVFWDHGGGSASGAALDENYDSDSLSLPELREAFEQTCEVNSEDPPYDIIGFDTCLMATVDVANIFKDVSRYLVGSEETEPGIGWCYNEWMGALAKDTTISAKELGKTICDTYYKACKENDYADEVTLSVTDLSKIDPVLTAYNDLGNEAILNLLNDGSFSGEFSRAAKKTENYGGNTKKSGYSDMADMGDLARHASEILPNSSKAVLDALAEAVVYQVKGKFKSHANGLSCFINYSHDEEMLENYYEASGTEAFKHYYGLNLSNDLSDEGYTYVSNLLDESGGEITQIPEIKPFDIKKLEDKKLKIEDGSTAVMNIGKEDASHLASVSYDLFVSYDKGDTFLCMGSAGTPDDVISDWENGVFKDNFRGVWGAIDENPVYMEAVCTNEDYTLYQIPIKLNGEEIFLYVACDNTTHEFTILGAHDELEHGLAPKDIKKLKPGDKIKPILFIMNEDDVEEVEMDSFTVTEDTSFDEIELGDGLYGLCFEMTGTDGKSAISDFELFKVKNSVMKYI